MQVDEKVLPPSPNFLEQFKIWCMAARPKTLTTSLIPISMGTILATSSVEQIKWFTAFFTLLSAILIQIGINLINDALDFKKGADNEHRIGFKRVSQLGLLTPQQVLRGGFICFALSLLAGIPLIVEGGWLFLSVLLVCMTFGYLYTGGPMPLAYYGLGEPFVLLFFGWVCTATAYYAQTHRIDYYPFLAGTQMGLLAVAILAINNLRDIKGDAQANKKTLAVLFGKIFAKTEISFCSLVPFFLGLYWLKAGHTFGALLPFLILPIVYRNLKLIWQQDPSPLYNRFFIQSALIHLLFGLLFIAGYFADLYQVQ